MKNLFVFPSLFVVFAGAAAADAVVITPLACLLHGGAALAVAAAICFRQYHTTDVNWLT